MVDAKPKLFITIMKNRANMARRQLWPEIVCWLNWMPACAGMTGKTPRLLNYLMTLI